jgi:hypothetical protein
MVSATERELDRHHIANLTQVDAKINLFTVRKMCTMEIELVLLYQYYTEMIKIATKWKKHHRITLR